MLNSYCFAFCVQSADKNVVEFGFTVSEIRRRNPNNGRLKLDWLVILLLMVS